MVQQCLHDPFTRHAQYRSTFTTSSPFFRVVCAKIAPKIWSKWGPQKLQKSPWRARDESFERENDHGVVFGHVRARGERVTRLSPLTSRSQHFSCQNMDENEVQNPREGCRRFHGIAPAAAKLREHSLFDRYHPMRKEKRAPKSSRGVCGAFCDQILCKVWSSFDPQNEDQNGQGTLVGATLATKLGDKP